MKKIPALGLLLATASCEPVKIPAETGEVADDTGHSSETATDSDSADDTGSSSADTDLSGLKDALLPHDIPYTAGYCPPEGLVARYGGYTAASVVQAMEGIVRPEFYPAGVTDTYLNDFQTVNRTRMATHIEEEFPGFRLVDYLNGEVAGIPIQAHCVDDGPSADGHDQYDDAYAYVHLTRNPEDFEGSSEDYPGSTKGTFRSSGGSTDYDGNRYADRADLWNWDYSSYMIARTQIRMGPAYAGEDPRLCVYDEDRVDGDCRWSYPSEDYDLSTTIGEMHPAVKDLVCIVKALTDPYWDIEGLERLSGDYGYPDDSDADRLLVNAAWKTTGL